MKKLITLLLSLLLTPFVSLAASQQVNFQEGVSYQTIVPQQPTSDKDKVEVVELFWYGCSHCHRFQPVIERWLKTIPANVKYVRLPAILNDSWTLLTKAFYTAEALGVLDKTHAALFNAIHNQKRRLDTEEAVIAFYAEQGVDSAEFRKVLNSFSTDSKVRRARLMTQRYGTTGTPSVIVNGKYRVDPGMAGGDFATMINIIDFLVKKESPGKG